MIAATLALLLAGSPVTCVEPAKRGALDLRTTKNGKELIWSIRTGNGVARLGGRPLDLAKLKQLLSTLGARSDHTGTVTYAWSCDGSDVSQATFANVELLTRILGPPDAEEALEIADPDEGATVAAPTLGPADILQVVKSRITDLRACLAEQHKREPGKSGKLVMRWTILPSGRVTTIEVVNKDHVKTYFAGCVAGVLESLTFPAHHLQGEPVVFPFKF